MHTPSYKGISLPAIAAGIAAAIFCCMTPVLEGADTNTNAVAKVDSKPGADAPKTKKKLTGSELYSIHCNRCHAERYPAEWNSREWQTIMLHMRVRANLPAVQAREIFKYLKEESGNQ